MLRAEIILLLLLVSLLLSNICFFLRFRFCFVCICLPIRSHHSAVGTQQKSETLTSFHLYRDIFSAFASAWCMGLHPTRPSQDEQDDAESRTKPCTAIAYVQDTPVSACTTFWHYRCERRRRRFDRRAFVKKTKVA